MDIIILYGSIIFSKIISTLTKTITGPATSYASPMFHVFVLLGQADDSNVVCQLNSCLQEQQRNVVVQGSCVILLVDDHMVNHPLLMSPVRVVGQM